MPHAIFKLFTLSMLGKKNWQTTFWKVFLLFEEKEIWHFMQTVSSGDSLHEMSEPTLWENMKNILNLYICKQRRPRSDSAQPIQGYFWETSDPFCVKTVNVRLKLNWFLAGHLYKLFKSSVYFYLRWVLRILGPINISRGPIKISRGPIKILNFTCNTCARKAQWWRG